MSLAVRETHALCRGERDVDVVVIGAGVNGAGVARDLAMRGFSVALFERNDIAFGASGNSSGMIHGGARYLTYDPAVTETSCRDSGHVQRIAPHLLFRIPFLFPVKQSPYARLMLAGMDGFFQAYDEYQPLKRGKPHALLTRDELIALEPGLHGDLAGGVSFDEYGIDGARLCTANVVDASERGAKIFIGASIEAVERRPDSGEVIAVRYRDGRSGKPGRLTTTAVVNATGAWAPITASLSGLDATTARVRPGKGIHVVYDRRLTNYAIATNAIDRRQIFLEPWQNMSVLGTTDDDYYGDLDDVTSTTDEVRYLVEGMARVFPAIRSARAIGTYAGVRPTIYKYGKHEDALSRDHKVIDHAANGAPGLYSMIGGKLASYRLFSEEAADTVAAAFRVTVRSTTHTSFLPGGDETLDPFAFANEHAIDTVAARRLIYRHGGRAKRIGERIRRKERERATVCVCEPVLEAEVRHVIRTEFVRTVADVARRTRLGLGACGGMRCALRCGQIVAEERGLSPATGQRQAASFLVRQQKTRLVVLGPEQARMEALFVASLKSEIDPTCDSSDEDG